MPKAEILSFNCTMFIVTDQFNLVLSSVFIVDKNPNHRKTVS